MFPEWTVVIGLYIGAAIGSFLNVVIYRMPLGMSIGKPTYSFCPKCRARLTFPDLTPLLSWLVLRGRCRHCSAKISARYFLVELFTGLVWAGIWWQHLVAGQDPWRAFCLAAFASALIAALFIDLEHYIIPDSINAFLLGVGLAYNAGLYFAGSPLAETNGLPSSVLGALLGIGIFWGITFFGRIAFGRDAMGHGDIKMARGIGAMLFPAAALLSFGLAVILGAVFGVLMLLLRRTDSGEPTHEEGEPDDEPEPLGSILLSGLGYLLCIDVIGLVFPKVYQAWFKEDPYAVEEIDSEAPIAPTMIPFGPYLAAGALLAAMFEKPLLAMVQNYWAWATGISSVN